MHSFFFKIFIALLFFSFITNCGGLSKTDTRKIPTNAQERARKNVEEGRGVGIGGLLKGGGKTNYEFSTSNPMWRASLEILDFIPMTTVDYAGGMIISDWYSLKGKSNERVKISVLVSTKELRADGLNVKVFKQVIRGNSWISTDINPNIALSLERKIVQKAGMLSSQID